MSRSVLVTRLGDYDILLAVSPDWFLATFVCYLFPPLFGRFQSDYGVSTATLGFPFTCIMVADGTMQFPSVDLGDRLGSIRTVVAGLPPPASAPRCPSCSPSPRASP